MDFSNERYVRLYVRDTTAFKLLPWQGQIMLPLVLKILDRAGVLDLGGVTPAEAVSVHYPRVPFEVITIGVEAMIERALVEHHSDALVWPKFLDAQDACQTDRQRQAEARAKRRDLARMEQIVTDRDLTSRTVTQQPESGQKRHVVSHGVTPAVPAIPAVLASSPNGNGSIGSRERWRDIWNEVVGEIEGAASKRLYERDPSSLPEKDGKKLDDAVRRFSEKNLRQAVKTILTDSWWRGKKIGVLTLSQGGNMERMLAKGGEAPPEGQQVPYSQFGHRGG